MNQASFGNTGDLAIQPDLFLSSLIFLVYQQGFKNLEPNYQVDTEPEPKNRDIPVKIQYDYNPDVFLTDNAQLFQTGILSKEEIVYINSSCNSKSKEDMITCWIHTTCKGDHLKSSCLHFTAWDSSTYQKFSAIDSTYCY
ncbi:hypothetical protein CEXT_117311 [Caerostris extrusa]|uniref:Uncharacterized protein n=1 Tax=Caerostris extrusa TaxID=172846 RepID=A0AAV4UYP4_CAEEX|nr:hypothetical protein CEXT_117311 [Caerostris extrusa]